MPSKRCHCHLANFNILFILIENLRLKKKEILYAVAISCFTFSSEWRERVYNFDNLVLTYTNTFWQKFVPMTYTVERVEKLTLGNIFINTYFFQELKIFQLTEF